MYETSRLTLAVSDVSDTAGLISHKIHGNPPGILDDLLARIKEALKSVQNSIISALTPLIKRVEDIIGGITDVISALVDKIVSIGEAMVNAIWSNLWDILDTLFETFGNALREIIADFKDALKSFGEWIGELVEAVKEKFQNAVGVLLDGLGDLAKAIREKISEIAKEIREQANAIVNSVKEFAERIGGYIISAYQQVTHAVTEALRDIWDKIREIYHAIQEKISEVSDWLITEVKPFLEKALPATLIGCLNDSQALIQFVESTVSGDADGIRAGLRTLLTRESEYDFSTYAIYIAVGIGTIMPAIGAIAAPALEIVQQEMRKTLLPGTLDINALGAGVIRGAISFTEACGEAARSGYSPRQLEIAVENSRTLLSPGEAGAAFMRGVINESTHDGILLKHGYTPDDIRTLKCLYWLIPSPNDLIRMAVKEAFSPEVAEKFGQYEDFPETFAEWAKKQGLSEEWAKRYWAAHWDLPSPQMGFEMLHRSIIDEDELKLLLRALDIMPWWREKLILLSYLPYTRVDIRRMYQSGVISQDEVYRAYRDLGYDDEKARNLTEFTVRYYSSEDTTELDEYRTLTKNVFITAFKHGLISRDECKSRLTEIGYHQDDADFLVQIAEAELALKATEVDTTGLKNRVTNLIVEGYRNGLYREIEARELLDDVGHSADEIDWYIALTDWEREHNLRELSIETIHQLYVTRSITKDEAIAKLGKYEITASEIEKRFELWEIERDTRVRKPTEAQFRAALGVGLITPDEYYEELRGLGYPDKYAEMLLKLAVRKAG